MSPARVDFVDPAGGTLKSSHRPQEAMGPHVFDQVVRNLNANATSEVKAGGKRAKLGWAITTGDLADNQHVNETRWFTQVLDGGVIDPMSGKPVGPGNPCTAEAGDLARINADAVARRYTGVQDYDDYPGAPADRYTGYYDPDAAITGPYAAFPRYPGLMDRAQQPFEAAGLDVDWYISRGNHDGLIQGNAPGSSALFRSIATSCDKVMPSDKVDPAEFKGKEESYLYDRLTDPAFLGQLLASARKVPPDPDRRIISKAEYKEIVGGNGFQHVSKTENTKSAGTASYYAFTPKKGLRFISLDTVSEGGGQYGNLDNAQYQWLKKELKAAKKRKQLVVAFGHHPLSSMISTNTDEDAGACADGNTVGCDVDPRTSSPMHRGTVGKQSVKSLFLANRNLISYVAGHIHENRVTLVKKGKRAFWEIATASHIDWPHQSRTIEIMDNRNGTLSLFGTILEDAAPIATPAAGTSATAFSSADLASIAREMAWNEPQRSGLPDSGESDSGEGTRSDRNVELLIRDPR
jgi:metallophosphoesterase (TIGR03767 family)